MLYLIIAIAGFVFGFALACLLAIIGLDSRIEEGALMFRSEYEHQIKKHSQAFKKHEQMLNAMAEYIGTETESCPAVKHNYKDIDCNNLCGEKGRQPRDGYSKCWLDYFAGLLKKEYN